MDLSKIFKALFLVSCLTFVIYKAGKCITRFVSGPTGIDLSMKDGTFDIFPDFTFCGRLNTTVLEECGLTWNDYSKLGKWSTSNGSEFCQDPNALIEKARIKLKNIIEETIIQFENSEVTIDSNKSEFWSMEYDPKGGTCYRFSIMPETHNDSVVSIKFYRGSTARTVYFNSPGYFHSDPRRRAFNFKNKNSTVIQLSYDIFKTLNHVNNPCNDTKAYTTDACFDALAYEESMKELNCTWPFNKKSFKICRDYDKAKKAKTIGEKYFKNKYDQCLVPCINLETKADGNIWESSKNSGRKYIQFKFKENVKVFEAYYTYNELSLIAEIGGYVGLFLGWSVQQLFDIPKKFGFVKKYLKQ